MTKILGAVGGVCLLTVFMVSCYDLIQTPAGTFTPEQTKVLWDIWGMVLILNILNKRR